MNEIAFRPNKNGRIGRKDFDAGYISHKKDKFSGGVGVVSYFWIEE